MVIVGGKIYTMVGAPIENGYIRVEGGKITEVGEMERYIPRKGEEVLETAGAGIYPGFVDAHSHLGLWEDSLGMEGDDVNEDTDPATPQLRAIDAVNPTERSFIEALDAGVTTVAVGPGSANAIAGRICVMKTWGCCVDDMLLREAAAMKFALGENPKVVYHAKGQTPVTRMATAALIREQLAKARRYMEDVEAAREDDELDEPDFDFKCEALIPVLKREIRAHFHCHRADDICTALRLSEEFELDTVLIHCTDGYKLAQRIAKSGYPAVVGPMLCARSKPELAGQALENAARLAAAGVKTAVCTDHPEVPQQYLALSAALAVRGGMPYEEALRAITLYPAQICGVDDCVGSIEPGKDADLVFFHGDPLSVYARPRLVMVNGETDFARNRT